MVGMWRAVLLMGALVVAPVWAESEQADAPMPAPVVEAPAETAGQEPSVVDVSITGEQVVTVNTGNEQVDEAANLVARCAERKAAHTACGKGLKAIACKKSVDMSRYRGLECPDI